MDTFEKMMENEATSKKDDFVEMVNFIMANRNDKSAIEDELSFFVDKLVCEHYTRGYNDAAKDSEKVMRKKIREAAIEIQYNAMKACPF